MQKIRRYDVDNCQKAFATYYSRITITKTGCWNWRMSRTTFGYGRVCFAGDYWMAHRVAWVARNGRDVPEGMDLDHLCRNPRCVNPEHVEPVTRQVNLLRGDTIQAKNAAKTHCKWGHEFTEANTYRDKRGSRHCKTCRGWKVVAA